MHPSFSVNLEPGLDRGVPWGCDLYTFVTSAAGHMMRTLQKPRKNRPSKRQVNHRRFLHNMIQRKFADIEAANHRLASAIYLKEEGKEASSPASEERDAVERTPVPLGEPPLPQAPARRGEGVAAWIQETHKPAKVSSTSPLGGPEAVPARPPAAQPGPGFPQSDPPESSPDLGLVEASAFPAQMFPDASACTEGQKGAADISESQWSEIMELLGVGGGHAEVEACFESIYACRGDGGTGVEPELGLTDFLDSFTDCPTKAGFEGGRSDGDACEYALEGGGQREAEDSFDVAPGRQGDRSEPQCLWGEGSCMLGSGPDFPTFRGVAQSFAVPLQYVKPRSIPTPPHEEDWPFTDILEDGAAAYD